MAGLDNGQYGDSFFYLWKKPPVKKLVFFFGILAFAGCKKDDPAPSGPATPLATDPRDVYTGNYHFTIVRQTHVMFPSHVYNDTTFFDGNVTKMTSNDTSVVIVYGTHSWDTLHVSPDNTDYFYIYSSYGVYTGAFNQSGTVAFSQYSIYNADSTCYDMVNGTKY